MEKDIEQIFNSVCLKLKDAKGLNNDDKLKFYGLYKVITEGKYDSSKDKEIGFFEFEKKAKYNSWKSLSSLNKTEAMKFYIKHYYEVTNQPIPEEVENLYVDVVDSEILNSISGEGMDFDFQQVSSTAKNDQKEIKEYLENASNNECVYYTINDDFNQNKEITVDYFNNFKHIDCKFKFC